MMEKNQLEEIRSEIDILDRQLAGLIEKRMELVNRVAEYKSKNKTQVLDFEREKKVIENAMSAVKNPDYSETIKTTFRSIMAHSREYQKNKISGGNPAPKNLVLIGEHLSHSMSVPIHKLFFEKTMLQGSYTLLEVPKNELSGVLKKLKADGCDGVNVTIPYKTDIMGSLDSLSEEVLRVGAVNTIKLDDKFTGYNTDYNGFGMALSYYGFEPKGKVCAVLGSGGASRAVVAYLQDRGASRIVMVSREPEQAKQKYPELDCIRLNEFSAQGYDLIVNATHVGMSPNAGFSPITREQLKGASFVMDLIYNPVETLLLQFAKESSIPCANGLYMLVAQAVAAQEIWQDKSFGSDIVNSIYDEMRKR